jgi:dUTPase
MGLVLGRSSMTMAGLTVFPGNIDSDYNTEI